MFAGLALCTAEGRPLEHWRRVLGARPWLLGGCLLGALAGYGLRAPPVVSSDLALLGGFILALHPVTAMTGAFIGAQHLAGASSPLSLAAALTLALSCALCSVGARGPALTLTGAAMLGLHIAPIWLN